MIKELTTTASRSKCQRLPILPVSFWGIIEGPQLVSDVSTIYRVIVGVDKLWDPEVFSNLVTENEPGRPRISSNCSRAPPFN